MDTTLLIAILGASVTAIGWLVTHILATIEERRKEQLNQQITFISRQLEELYGPLAFLILEGNKSFQDLLGNMGRNHVFLDDKISSEELDMWVFYIENDLFPRNQKIRDLLSTKTHLVEGSTIPKSFVLFLEHYNSWKLNHELWKLKGKDYKFYSKINWPTDFEKETMRIFQNLKARHFQLIEAINTPSRFLTFKFKKNRSKKESISLLQRLLNSNTEIDDEDSMSTRRM